MVDLEGKTPAAVNQRDALDDSVIDTDAYLRLAELGPANALGVYETRVASNHAVWPGPSPSIARISIQIGPA